MKLVSTGPRIAVFNFGGRVALTTFDALALAPALQRTLSSLGFERPTPVQAEALPPLLDGRDLIVQAQTGSGKTLAFSLGILQGFDVERFCIQGLVLCPTRELADQVAVELRRLARGIHNVKVLTLCGGAPIGPQIGSLEHGAHFIVGTPGRVGDHLRKGRLDFSSLKFFVLDEADRMLDMGFQDELEAIREALPSKRQSLLFSATYSDSVKALATSTLNDALVLDIQSEVSEPDIEQRFFSVRHDQREQALITLLRQEQARSAVIFCSTREECKALSSSLHQAGFSVAALHGDMVQKDRDRTLIRFAGECLTLLIATDVAARGLDVDHVELVVNYRVAKDREVHTHRIGRTGRAGKSGRALTLCDSREEERVRFWYDEAELTLHTVPPESAPASRPAPPPRDCLQIDGGKRQKLRPGDILGALTGVGGLDGKAVGKIQVGPTSAFVAVDRAVSKSALHTLQTQRMKGRQFKARIVKR